MEKLLLRARDGRNYQRRRAGRRTMREYTPKWCRSIFGARCGVNECARMARKRVETMMRIIKFGNSCDETGGYNETGAKLK